MTNALSSELFTEALNEKFRDLDDFSQKHFSIEAGRKYDRIVQEAPSGERRAVFAFVDRETGDLYKPAGWKAPAKGVRYEGNELLTRAVEEADVYGGYLYKRR